MEELDKVVLNKKGKEYALENIKANRLSKIIKKAIMGLTLAGGLILTGCGEKKVDESFIIADNYEEYETRYKTEHKEELSETDVEALQLVSEWVNSAGKSNTINYDEVISKYGEKEALELLAGYCGGMYTELSKATDVFQALLFEDVSKNLPKGISYVDANNFSIKADYDDNGLYYYVEIKDVNAFSSDNNTVYKSKITDELLIKILEACNVVASKGYTKEAAEEFNNDLYAYIHEGESYNTDLSKFYSGDKFREKYTFENLSNLRKDLYDCGNELMLGIQTAVHSNFKFDDWYVGTEDTVANQYKR